MTESVWQDAVTVELSDSDRYQILASQRRRIVLDIVADWQPPISLAELATAVVEREREADGSDKVTVDQVRISLHHNHLPKLSENGILDYDPQSHTIHHQENDRR